MNKRGYETINGRRVSFLVPKECSTISTAAAVGRRAAALLNACEGLNWAVARSGRGSAVDMVQRFNDELARRLRAEGWRVTVSRNRDKWVVLPPVAEKKGGA